MALLAWAHPLWRWWNLVRSWSSPALSSCVVTCVVLWAAFPSRGTVVALVALTGLLLWCKGADSGVDGLRDAAAAGQPLPMLDDLPADDEVPPSQQQRQQGGGVEGEALLPQPMQPTGLPHSRSSAEAFDVGSPPSPRSGLARPPPSSSSLFGGASSSSAVPLDTFDNLKSQYDGVVNFLSLV